MKISKLLNTLTSAANFTDIAAAAAINKKLSNYTVFKSSATDVKLSTLLLLCNNLNYDIIIKGHDININLNSFLNDKQDQTSTK